MIIHRQRRSFVRRLQYDSTRDVVSSLLTFYAFFLKIFYSYTNRTDGSPYVQSLYSIILHAVRSFVDRHPIYFRYVTTTKTGAKNDIKAIQELEKARVANTDARVT